MTVTLVTLDFRLRGSPIGLRVADAAIHRLFNAPSLCQIA